MADNLLIIKLYDDGRDPHRPTLYLEQQLSVSEAIDRLKSTREKSWIFSITPNPSMNVPPSWMPFGISLKLECVVVPNTKPWRFSQYIRDAFLDQQSVEQLESDARWLVEEIRLEAQAAKERLSRPDPQEEVVEVPYPSSPNEIECQPKEENDGSPKDPFLP